ncbi:NAD-dependent epimerase/dehydratase family protein [Ornithinimicrobium avium]|uniref:Oxidoreductase n=1 Tax=Ornithinimicrobium avium TaxID=2283195 RepID=A0A345NPT6_9MICO|nr:NAD-dependent epimerase/dehydratase family protein [Ornithinimicrobium avium]AXH97044.1 oxidoreductase [Ornithinimicrobium avium]
MELLLLGGTAFLGREVARAALAGGHDLTCLARGTAPAPGGVTLVTADRDQDDALAPVSGRSWDAVVDLTRQPGHARRAVRDLTTAHWVFVSSANVYVEGPEVDRDEGTPLVEPLEADLMSGMEDYGAAKVACERAFAGSGTSATLVRAGLIGGPGDLSARSGYWPWRFAHPVDGGGQVAVPDDPDFPCALVDVRDLAAWIVAAAQERLDGPFNATGPTTTLAGVLAEAAEVGGSGSRARPIPLELLKELGVNPWAGPRSMPLWIDVPGLRGFATMDTARARAAGLVCRPLAGTLRGALATEEERTGPRPSGLTDDEEREVLAAVGRPGRTPSVRRHTLGS